MKNAIRAVALAAILGSVFGAGVAFAEAPKKAPVLREGHYTAQLKPFVCAGCPELIQRTMTGTKGIGSVSLEETTVHFTVKKGASVKLADLQRNLKIQADKMGMGADYSLANIKPMKEAGRAGHTNGEDLDDAHQH